MSCLDPKFFPSAIVLTSILGCHPQRQLSPDIVRLTSGLDLADRRFDSPNTTHLILGSDVLGRILLGNMKVLQPNGLVAVSTIFGFAVMGPVLKAAPPPEPDCAPPLVGTGLADSPRG